MKKSILFLFALLVTLPLFSQEKNTTRKQRNYIVEGNELYRAERYAEAEVAYRKALESDALNDIALFNLAASLLRQTSPSNDTQKEAASILQSLAKNAQNTSVAENAFYNLGNLAFNSQDYAQSIEHYKNALRRNPENDKARDNLRLAQKRLQEQQQNKDNSQNDQNKDKDEQQKQDQQKQQNQNQDQNQDKKDDDRDKQDNQQQQNEKQQPPKNQQSGGISQENAEKILKAMENEENATRARINAEKKKNGAPNRRSVVNPW